MTIKKTAKPAEMPADEAGAAPAPAIAAAAGDSAATKPAANKKAKSAKERKILPSFRRHRVKKAPIVAAAPESSALSQAVPERPAKAALAAEADEAVLSPQDSSERPAKAAAVTGPEAIASPQNSHERHIEAAAAEPEMRSGRARNPLIVFGNFVFMLAAFIIAAAALLLYTVKNLYEQPGRRGQIQTILIPPGSGVQTIADLLKKQGLIDNAPIFVYGTYLGEKARLLKAGEYEIPAQASMQEIADILAHGRPVQHVITIPEGLTVAQIFARLAQEPLLVGDLPADLPPEGSLMTNTVQFIRGTARRAIVKRLAEGQARLVDGIWAQRSADLPLQSREDMVILASIVEKETGIAAERPRIAAVFYNRLKKHMRLQSDPTVLYGVFGGRGRPANRPIYRSDLDQETAYNTYKIFGLPPTPICNPGRDSLLAVAHPPQTEDLYFVADGSGGHIFAVNLDEHNSNVAKWRALKKARQQEQADRREKAAREAGPPAVPAAPAPERKKTALWPEAGGWKQPAWGSSGGLIEEQP